MTTNYHRGRAREYQVMKMLRDSGWVCTRSAMSHGPVDIVAAKAGRVKLIQVKSGSARANKIELSLLRKWATAFNAAAEVWSFGNKKKGGQPIKVVVCRRRDLLKKKASTDLSKVTTEEPQVTKVAVQTLEIPPVIISSGTSLKTA